MFTMRQVFEFFKPKKQTNTRELYSSIPYHAALLIYCNEDGSLKITTVQNKFKHPTKNIEAAEILILKAIDIFEQEMDKLIKEEENHEPNQETH